MVFAENKNIPTLAMATPTALETLIPEVKLALPTATTPTVKAPSLMDFHEGKKKSSMGKPFRSAAQLIAELTTLRAPEVSPDMETAYIAHSQRPNPADDTLFKKILETRRSLSSPKGIAA